MGRSARSSLHHATPKPLTEITSAAHMPSSVAPDGLVGHIDRLALSAREDRRIEALVVDPEFHALLERLRRVDAYSHRLSARFETGRGVAAVPALRQLKTAYAMPAGQFVTLLADVVAAVAPGEAPAWSALAAAVCAGPASRTSIRDLLLAYNPPGAFLDLFHRLETEDPHAVYPTSIYRTSSGAVSWAQGGEHIEAVMTTSTMTEILIAEGVLDPASDTLRKIYQPLGRCVCVVDENVDDVYGREIEAYFRHHGVALVKRAFRAMEVDKSIRTVETMLGHFKQVGVSRNEPVLVIGGGVLADTAGLACALYHRNTPYVMLATSIVSGIDAGPSPRTCCDGFGYKNLFGAYHAPILTLTDRTFFPSLRPGWLRHGVAEVVKMAVVKDLALFELMEDTGLPLATSHFGASATDPDLRDRGHRVLAAAMRSYVEAEYGNLYETHQCRPHAYGHTWSPGFEIPSGMLHGHAVGCGMGFGAFLSERQGWITADERARIMRLISTFELSLWHPVLDETDIVYEAQRKMTQKRGGNLCAPLPRGGIGQVGYLNEMTRPGLDRALAEYRDVCQDFPRAGAGVEPHCADVGLEDPSTVSPYAVAA